jgi:hypothetical protein
MGALIMLKSMRIGLLAVGIALVAACAGTSTTEETYDGLVRVPEARFGDVYQLPGADLSGYGALGLAPCEVAFRKNWLRDQNSASMDLGSRLTQQDVDTIRDALAAECDRYFREALLQAPAYDLVETFDNGEAVLVLRPSIINLDINAPDTMSAGWSRSYTTSAGEMTLSLEAVDGTTGQVLVRVIDRRRGSDSGRMEWTNGVTNRAEADRILRRWAGQLRKGLDATLRQ